MYISAFYKVHPDSSAVNNDTEGGENADLEEKQNKSKKKKQTHKTTDIRDSACVTVLDLKTVIL